MKGRADKDEDLRATFALIWTIEFMKKWLFIVALAFAFSCESRNESSDRGAGSELEEKAPVDPAEPDESDIHSDSTTSGGVNRQNQYDTLD